MGQLSPEFRARANLRLVNDISIARLRASALSFARKIGEHKAIMGAENIDKVIRIDQSPIGRTPRSNPATYTGVSPRFVTSTPCCGSARARLQARTFFLQRPRRTLRSLPGEGQRRIEMNFLPDVYVLCEVCGGRRYNHETLAVKYNAIRSPTCLKCRSPSAAILENIPQIKQKLQTLNDVGLGYIHLGQSAVTLSGGEAQRLIGSELASARLARLCICSTSTTGLHFDDVKSCLTCCTG